MMAGSLAGPRAYTELRGPWSAAIACSASNVSPCRALALCWLIPAFCQLARLGSKPGRAFSRRSESWGSKRLHSRFRAAITAAKSAGSSRSPLWKWARIALANSSLSSNELSKPNSRQARSNTRLHKFRSSGLSTPLRMRVGIGLCNPPSFETRISAPASARLYNNK